MASPLSYSSSQVGQQKRTTQVKGYGRRIRILGGWQPDKSFDYALVPGSFNNQRYLQVLNWIAQNSEQTLQRTGRFTVIVQDNGSSDPSHLAREHWQQWRLQGLYLFFLPPDCSELNQSETQWHQLKADEIAGRIFDNEYDLAKTIMQGMEHRSQQGGYLLERFMFKST